MSFFQICRIGNGDKTTLLLMATTTEISRSFLLCEKVVLADECVLFVCVGHWAAPYCVICEWILAKSSGSFFFY